MDLLGSYDSDEETVQDSSSDPSNHTNSVNNSLEEYRNKYNKLNVPKNHKNRHRFNLNSNSQFKPSTSSDISLLSYDDKESQSSCRSRVYLDYDKAEHLNKLTSKSSELELQKKSREETVLYDPSKDSSLVVSIELGSRNEPSGLLKFSNETELNLNNRNLKGLRNRSEQLSKSLSKEHTRKEEDMMYSNYPVDHPLYKSHTTIANYKTEGYKSETFGSVHTNPSGVAEKVYYNESAFQDVLLRNDLKVVLHNDHTVGDTKRRRLTSEEVNSEDVFGPWIPFEEGDLPVYTEDTSKDSKQDKDNQKTKTRSKNQLGAALPGYPPEKAIELNEVEVNDGKQTTKFNDINVSTFHRKVETDKHYKSWLLAPKNAKVYDAETYKAFLPKQEIFTYVGHTMAVQKIEFIPRTGHYLLSASMDGFVKIWDVNNTRKCVRTYKGHSKGVRDISFVEGGAKFFSCSFDSNCILWDTEYGKIVGVYPIDKTPYCLTVYPNDESIFIVGGENKKACQFDSRTGEIVLEYSEHLGCVNTVTFIDNNRRILTTGDDKKLLVWDYNIPVVVKQISNPTMHTVPAVVNHPNDKFILAQSMDNQIVVYESSGSRFKQFGRKKFRGHQNSGYAIKPTCSPDGRYVASGDTRGKLFIWDWKTCKNLQTLSGHKAVTMDCKWHPSYPSTLATCSWDGTIKLWE